MAVFSSADKSAKDRLLESIKARPGEFAPPVFFLAAQHLQMSGNSDDAYFWFCFGRLRARYDAARCADESARSGVDVLVQKTPATIRSHIVRIPVEALVPFGRRIVELDSATPYNYDHRWISLHGVGALTDGTQNLCVPEAQWPELRRKNHQGFLSDLEATAAMLRQKAAVP